MLQQPDHQQVRDALLGAISDRWKLRFSDAEEEAQFRSHIYLQDSEWMRVRLYGASEERRKERLKLLRWAERTGEALAEQEIQKFFAKYFPTATESERTFMREQIIREAKAPDSDSDFSLLSMIEGGLPAVRARFRRRHLRHLNHWWPALKGLLAVAAVLLVFAKLNSDFERLCFSLLVLLMTHQARIAWVNSIVGADHNIAGWHRFLKLKELVTGSILPEEHEDTWQLEKVHKASVARYYVIDTARSLVNLIVYLHLLGILLS